MYISATGNKKSLIIGIFMGLGILDTNQEHEDRFHCKVSLKIAYIENIQNYFVLTFLLI